MYRMLTVAIAAIAALVMARSAYADRVYYIHNDPGGLVLEYRSKYAQVSAGYDRVVIDGRCKSACTMVLGIVPLDRICITSRGYFMFHAAHMSNGDRTFNGRGTQTMMGAYAPEVRDWVMAHHALDQVDPYTTLYARDVTFVRHCGSGKSGALR